MAAQNRTTLKGYFETGDTPTEAEFADLIDSFPINAEDGADVTDAGNVGSAIHGASSKSTPVDADTVGLIDSADSNSLKKLSWSNVKATLKTYFDTLYQSVHANLTAFAGLSLVADRLPYANGTGTLALATFTAAGRALIDDADAAAQLTTLGGGTSATGSGGVVRATSPTIASPTFSGTIAGTYTIGGTPTFPAAVALATGDVFTGTHDFGGADDLEIPNGTSITLDTAGQVGIDTSVTNWSHGLLEYYSGEVMGVVAMPIAQFSGMTDGYVVAYNATNDEFELVSNSGAGGDAWSDPVDADIVPDADGTRDLGSSSNRFAELHVDTIDLNGVTLDGSTNLSDPGADRIMFWDDSAGAVTWLTAGSGLSISDTTVTVNFSGYYSSGGTDVAVADGGTGRSTSTTAYGLIAAGTTATGAHQTLAAGATTEILVGGGASALPAWTTATGSGAPVRATSPTLVTPALGTPSSGTLTNCSGLPASGLVASTSQAVGFGSIELGHASDTTIARTASGRVTIEGAEVVRSSSTQGGASTDVIQNIVSCTTAEHGGITPDANTLYFITDAS